MQYKIGHIRPSDTINDTKEAFNMRFSDIPDPRLWDTIEVENILKLDRMAERSRAAGMVIGCESRENATTENNDNLPIEKYDI